MILENFLPLTLIQMLHCDTKDYMTKEQISETKALMKNKTQKGGMKTRRRSKYQKKTRRISWLNKLF